MRNQSGDGYKWLVSIKRDQATANSGIVVELKLEDFKPFAKYGALAGMEFKSIEQKHWVKLKPAQRMIDFTQSRVSSKFRKHHTFLGLLP
jgi:uncharacterized FAD-dependent dehydrogenase